MGALSNAGLGAAAYTAGRHRRPGVSMNLRRWILVASMLSCHAVLAGVGVLPEGALLVSPESLKIPSTLVAADAGAVVAHVLRGENEAALGRLRAVRDPVHFEAAAVAVIDELQRRPPSTAADRLLAALAQEPVRVFRRHDETAGDWFLPLFDVPGRAQSARTQLARVAARDRLLPKLRRGETRFLVAGASDPAALVAALEQLTAVEAGTLAARVLHDGDTLAPGAWSALARRSPEPDTLDAVLRFEHSAETLALLQQLPATLPSASAYAWLDRALAFGDYRSAAVAGIGREAARSPVASRKLVELLGATDSTTGASAAAALARLPAGQRLAEYDRILAKSRDATLLARLALALRLDDTPPARERLQRLKNDSRLPGPVRAELQR
jgi:hypothetical protein